MTTTTGDSLVQSCCLLPVDEVRRFALSDWLDENGEPELAECVRGPTGERLVRATLAAAIRMKREPDVLTMYGVRFAGLLTPQIIVYHPPGLLDQNNPDSRQNRDYAIEICEGIYNGQSVVFPDIRNPDGEPAWRVQVLNDPVEWES